MGANPEWDVLGVRSSIMSPPVMMNELAKTAWREREMESTRWQSRQQRGSRVVVGSDQISRYVRIWPLSSGERDDQVVNVDVPLSPCTQYDGTKFCRQAWSGPNEDPSKGRK